MSLKEARVVIIVSGLIMCDSDVLLGFDKLRVSAELLDNIPSPYPSELHKQIIFRGETVKTDVFILIDPPQYRVKEVLSAPCSNITVYYGGHANANGSWDLSYSDEDSDSNYLSFEEFKECKWQLQLLKVVVARRDCPMQVLAIEKAKLRVEAEHNPLLKYLFSENGWDPSNTSLSQFFYAHFASVARAVIIVSGLSEYDDDILAGLKKLRVPSELLDNIPSPYPCELHKQIIFPEATVKTDVFILIDPPQYRVKNVLSAPCSYITVYYGGHANANGSWDLSYSDEDSDSNYLSIEEFKECVGNKQGELYLNCCYSTKCIEIATTKRSSGSGALVQLHASGEEYSHLTNEEYSKMLFAQVGLRIHAIKIDKLPVEAKDNLLMKYLLPEDGWDPSSNTSLFQLYESGHRASILNKNLPGLPLTEDSFAFYSFPSNGSADCFLIVTGDDFHNILVDSSKSAGFTNAWNAVLGRIKLHLAICTHSDDDHIGGFDKMAKSNCLDVIDELWLNPCISPIALPPPSPPAIPTRSKKQAHDVLMKYAQIKEKVPPIIISDDIPADTLENSEFGTEYPEPKKEYIDNKTKVTVLWPNAEFFFRNYREDNSKKINNMSIVLVVSYAAPRAAKHILLTGDVDCDILVDAIEKSDFKDTKFEIAVIPHHGSYNSHYINNTWYFRRINTKRFIITGNSTRYEHPHPHFLTQLMDMMRVQSTLEVYFNHENQAIAFQNSTNDSGIKKRVFSVNTTDSNGHKFIKISLVPLVK
eukprot:gene6174-6807_t